MTDKIFDALNTLVSLVILIILIKELELIKLHIHRIKSFPKGTFKEDHHISMIMLVIIKEVEGKLLREKGNLELEVNLLVSLIMLKITIRRDLQKKGIKLHFLIITSCQKEDLNKRAPTMETISVILLNMWINLSLKVR